MFGRIYEKCACQGAEDTGGASFSFGCSWSYHYNGCKYRRSNTVDVRNFKLKNPTEEDMLRSTLQELGTDISVLLKEFAPDAHSNMVRNILLFFSRCIVH